MASFVNLLKLSVGSESVESLTDWQATGALRSAEGLPCHVTRMWPRREAEVIAGGSIYWVIKGIIQCRQRIVRLEEVTRADGIRRCAIVMDPEVIRTTPAPKRAFQGWRYLAPGDAPLDLSAARISDDALPPDLSAALADIGVL